METIDLISKSLLEIFNVAAPVSGAFMAGTAVATTDLTAMTDVLPLDCGNLA